MSRPGDPHSELRAAIGERRAVLVAGTGVSIAATGNHPQASWDGLLKHGLAWLRKHDLIPEEKARAHLSLMQDADAGTHHFISAAQDITKQMGGPTSTHYKTWLRETVGSLVVRDPAGIEALHALRAHGNLLATTNYDSLLLHDGSPLTPVTWDQPEALLEAVRHKQTDKVLFLHGHWRRSESVVLDWTSYDRIARNDQYRDDLSACWHTATWVYVGCGINGLTDPDLGLLLDRYGGRLRTTGLWDFCLVRGDQREELQALFDERGLNIAAVPFGERHTHLPAYLRSLLPQLEQPATATPDPAAPAAGQGRPSAPDLYAQPDYLGGHDFVGRKSELDQLGDWARPADPTNLLLFEAIGGSGKSMLTWTWVTDQAPIVRADWAGRFWYSFYERGAVMADFCRHALAYMTGQPLESLERMRTRELAPALVAELHARPWLLVLDGLERVLVAYHRFDAAGLPDEAADRPTDAILDRNPIATIRDEDGDLLRLLAGARPSKILVTSRLTPQVLLNQAGQPIPGAKRQPLGGLRPDDAEAMFRASGARGDSDRIRHYLAENCDNHPLMIGVLAGLVVNYLPARGDFDAWADDMGPNGGGRLDLAQLDLVQRRNHILRAALNDLTETSREVLSTLALFPGSIDYETLVGVNPLLPPEPEEDAVRDAGQKLADAVHDLEQRGLLQYDHVSQRHDLHPVVRGVSFGELEPADLQRHGQRLVDLFTTAPHDPYEQARTLDDVAPVLNLTRTLLKLGRLSEAADAMDVQNLDLALLINLEAPFELLALLRPFFNGGWDELVELPRRRAMAISMAAGNALAKVGNTDAAIAAHGVSITTALAMGQWPGVSIRLRNLVGSLGDTCVAKQLRLVTLALDLATLLREEAHVFKSRLLLFSALSSLGRWDSATETWQRLDAMGRRWPRSLYVPGDAEYLFAVGQYQQGLLVEEHLTTAAALADANRSRLVQRSVHGLRGMWRLDQGDWALAAESLAEAVRMARERRIPDGRSEAGLALSKLHLGLLTADEARQEALRLEGTPSAEHLLARIWQALGEVERSKTAALAAYAGAWADGEPYVFRHSLTKASELLGELDVAIPDLPPYDPDTDVPFPWEGEVQAGIDRLRAERSA